MSANAKFETPAQRVIDSEANNARPMAILDGDVVIEGDTFEAPSSDVVIAQAMQQSSVSQNRDMWTAPWPSELSNPFGTSVESGVVDNSATRCSTDAMSHGEPKVIWGRDFPAGFQWPSKPFPDVDRDVRHSQPPLHLSELPQLPWGSRFYTVESMHWPMWCFFERFKKSAEALNDTQRAETIENTRMRHFGLLQSLNEKYELQAVLCFHCQYYADRIREMKANGDSFEGWATDAEDLQLTYLSLNLRLHPPELSIFGKYRFP